VVPCAFDHRGQHDRQMSRTLCLDAEAVAHSSTISHMHERPVAVTRRRTWLPKSVNAVR